MPACDAPGQRERKRKKSYQPPPPLTLFRSLSQTRAIAQPHIRAILGNIRRLHHNIPLNILLSDHLSSPHKSEMIPHVT